MVELQEELFVIVEEDLPEVGELLDELFVVEYGFPGVDMLGAALHLASVGHT
jgi:hypothetical protein